MKTAFRMGPAVAGVLKCLSAKLFIYLFQTTFHKQIVTNQQTAIETESTIIMQQSAKAWLT